MIFAFIYLSGAAITFLFMNITGWQYHAARKDGLCPPKLVIALAALVLWWTLPIYLLVMLALDRLSGRRAR